MLSLSQLLESFDEESHALHLSSSTEEADGFLGGPRQLFLLWKEGLVNPVYDEAARLGSRFS
ncbi:MAG: hypothetical protein JRH01_19795 [Deltaproteobacteria bacterium]|nr:hypothetical protein [Deltaproteobacteria bacterium]